jgi:ribonuclease HI
MAPSSFAYASWTGTSADWGSPDRSSRLIYSLLDTTPELQQSLSHRLQPDRVWFALTRRSNLDRGVKRVLERTGQGVKVFKKGTKVTASKGSSSTGKLRAIQSLEDWCVWASKAATQTGLDTVGAHANTTGRDAESGLDRGDPIHEALMAAQVGASGGTGDSRETARISILKHRLDAIRLTTDGVVPLDLACASSRRREALLGPAGAAYMRSRIVVATDGSLKKCGAMGAAFVAKDGRVQARSVAVFGQPSSIRPDLTGIALALEECPIEEDLTILTDSLSSMDLLQSMQRGDFPLSLYRHSVRHLLLHVVTLLNRRAAAGRITRFLKVRAHRGEPLNEAADALAAAAADLDPGRPVAIDLES